MTSKDNFEFAHAHRKEVAWMSQNTNTLPVHPAILDAIRASADEQEFNLYPRKAGVVGLSEAIKEDLRLDDVEMILTNGGIEGEYIATRALLKAGTRSSRRTPPSSRSTTRSPWRAPARSRRTSTARRTS